MIIYFISVQCISSWYGIFILGKSLKIKTINSSKTKKIFSNHHSYQDCEDGRTSLWIDPERFKRDRQHSLSNKSWPGINI